MPHVIVKLFPGRSNEQKIKLTEELTKAVTESLNLDESTVSIAFEEVPQEKWADEVYKPDIINKEETLYKKPGYKMG